MNASCLHMRGSDELEKKVLPPLRLLRSSRTTLGSLLRSPPRPLVISPLEMIFERVGPDEARRSQHRRRHSIGNSAHPQLAAIDPPKPITTPRDVHRATILLTEKEEEEKGGENRNTPSRRLLRLEACPICIVSRSDVIFIDNAINSECNSPRAVTRWENTFTADGANTVKR